MIQDLLDEIYNAKEDGTLTSLEMFGIAAEAFSVAENICRTISKKDVDKFYEIKQDVRLYLLELTKGDNQSIPNWMEPFVESQLISLVDPILDGMWERIHEDQ